MSSPPPTPSPAWSHAGERVLVLGGPGLIDALRTTGATVVDAGDPGSDGLVVDTVVVGLTRDFDYARLDRASAAARRGARLIASNTDSTFPAADGLRPGCGGSLLRSRQRRVSSQSRPASPTGRWSNA